MTKYLRTCLAVDGEKINEYKEAMHTLNGKVITLTDQVEKLGGVAC